MANQSNRGKVLEFDPNRKRKLKSTNYIDPEKKKLKKTRDQHKNFASNTAKPIQYTAIFVLLCLVVYIFKMSF